jgi:hypothetical protein
MGNKNSGRRPDENTIETRQTSVRGNAKNMDKVKADGHSYSEVFEFGLKCYVESGLRGDESEEEILEQKEKNDLELKKIIARGQILDLKLENIAKRKLDEAKEKEKILEAIESISNSLYLGQKNSLNNQALRESNFNYVISQDPTGKLTRTELREFFKTFSRPITLNSYREFIKGILE